MSSMTPQHQPGDNTNPLLIPNNPPLIEVIPDQLPTPVTFDQNVSTTNPGQIEQGPMMGMADETYLADFLKDIIMPYTPFPNGTAGPTGHMSGTFTPRDVMDFGISNGIDLDGFDFASFTTFDEGSPLYMNTVMAHMMNDAATPAVQNSIDMGSEAFRKSIWRWTPTHERGNAEQLDLAVDTNDTSGQKHSRAFDHRTPAQRLGQKGRDKILGLLLGICDSANLSRIVSAFPSANVLDSFLCNFFHFAEHQDSSWSSSWIHIHTLDANNLRPELISMMVAAGATLSSSRTVRRLGYAIAETVRLSIPKMFETRNVTTRELRSLQAFLLQLNVDVWSGNKRRMELAESHLLPLVTMLRRASRFQRAKFTDLPLLDDVPDALDKKWRSWVELSYRTFILSAQVSMALLIPPLISNAEMSLDLPAPETLWNAKSAEEWRNHYIAIHANVDDRDPSLVQCLYNITALEECQHRVDKNLSLAIVLHGLGSLVWEYRQMSSSLKAQTSSRQWNGPLIYSSWHNELCQLLSKYQVTISEWDINPQREPKMLLELLSMNLHVSFEELQLLAGKEGEEEARRVYPSLKIWVESQSSRDAVWHAGQVLRAASESPHGGELHDFYAVALYHAGLAFWVYGIISRAVEHDKQQRGAIGPMDTSLVWLDGRDLVDRHRFVALHRGLPVISDWGCHDIADRTGQNHSPGNATAVQLSDPKAVMEVIILVLKRLTARDTGLASPLVENLTQLMRDLANAARAFGW
ncbi:putative c2h2 type zinc finger domain protein [Phaeomoniella chlamydospora]|uniref:Putative c2h2 type zinc finger domain protein n=1 Tax=Phaeomoniella chlamydospora TaxID=158046 RepID=A0A0G2E3E5_PHACM|nr:putative c2h2 type zinc finger domain protein [Phaeomoniella chlamydospora]